jgi:hypothetical protein
MIEDVLIVGAEPTGLALAAQVHAHGALVRGLSAASAGRTPGRS